MIFNFAVKVHPALQLIPQIQVDSNLSNQFATQCFPISRGSVFSSVSVFQWFIASVQQAGRFLLHIFNKSIYFYSLISFYIHMKVKLCSLL